MELSDIQNVQYNVWVSQKFLNEVENVATKSTNDIRGTSAVVCQLGTFITNVIRFLKNIGNFAHAYPYVELGNERYGYNTNLDDTRNGVGTIIFIRLPNDDGIYVEDILLSLEASSYTLLTDNKQLNNILSLIERIENL